MGPLSPPGARVVEIDRVCQTVFDDCRSRHLDRPSDDFADFGQWHPDGRTEDRLEIRIDVDDCYFVRERRSIGDRLSVPDEAEIVQGNRFQVIGKSQVAVYGAENPADGGEPYLMLSPGSTFNLQTRRPK